MTNVFFDVLNIRQYQHTRISVLNRLSFFPVKFRLKLKGPLYGTGGRWDWWTRACLVRTQVVKFICL